SRRGASVALLRYVCSLPNPGTKGAIRELFYPDNPEGRARAEKFAQHENKPGRGVYDCIGRLQDGARSRCKDTVADLEQVVADLDLKNITQRRDAVLQCVKGLVLPPSEIRDSGFGLHLIWHLKEPVEDDDGLAQAETTMKRLAELLAGDLKPTHRAAPASSRLRQHEGQRTAAVPDHRGGRRGLRHFGIRRHVRPVRRPPAADAQGGSRQGQWT